MPGAVRCSIIGVRSRSRLNVASELVGNHSGGDISKGHTLCHGDSIANADRSEGCHRVSATDSLWRMPGCSAASCVPSVGSQG